MEQCQSPEARDEFLLKNYELLFERNAKAQEHRWNFMQLSLLGVFAFYASIFSQTTLTEGAAKVAMWIPVVLSVLGAIHAWALRQGSFERGAVMTDIEKYFGGIGWQSERARKNRGQVMRRPLTTVTYLYWFAIFCLTTFVALKMQCGDLFVKKG